MTSDEEEGGGGWLYKFVRQKYNNIEITGHGALCCNEKFGLHAAWSLWARQLRTIKAEK